MIISGWGHFCDIAITISSIQTLLALLFICCKSLNAVFAFIHDISGRAEKVPLQGKVIWKTEATSGLQIPLFGRILNSGQQSAIAKLVESLDLPAPNYTIL